MHVILKFENCSIANQLLKNQNFRTVNLKIENKKWKKEWKLLKNENFGSVNLKIVA